ncbi:hypothetical protein QMK33_06605 [Hymenobacter sp. H14-R3]|uniref:hypothetical protein n=1 Tax=Hymenobacter sp. H14-R3 TaxID=3046308 RepID=UPI0024BA2F8A|nr:hypothetical protein [Hymenobacter sp. H14-R3]MDJ0364817.1 hypothetical protein [Hymenobacter sp. H14-R3]
MSETPLTTAPATVPCPKCGTQLPCYDPTASRYFGCFKCRAYFYADAASPAASTRYVTGFKKTLVPGPSLPLGTVGLVGGHRCRITGYQVRTEKNDKSATWREYQLSPPEPGPTQQVPADFPLQLAEYHGHWLLIRRAPSHPANNGKKGYKETTWLDDTTDRLYKLWHRYQPDVLDAEGEFDWDILEDEKLFVTEFICPPYILVSEHLTSGPPTWYLAEHLEPEVVATAFYVPVNQLPNRYDVGAAQPNPVAGPAMLRVAVLLLLALLGLRSLVGQWRPSTTTTQQLELPATPLAQPTAFVIPPDNRPPIIPYDSLPAAGTPATPEPTQQSATAVAAPPPASTMLVTNSFTLAEPTALQIELAIPSLSNRWVEITASLVNEENGRGYEFTRSLEYYSGVEGGESWSEGSTSASAVFSSVPAGRYHLNLYPSAEPTTETATLQVTIEQNTELTSNLLLAILSLLAIPALQWWRYSSFETSRWENSNFGPQS